VTKTVAIHLGTEFVPVAAFYGVSQFHDFTTSAAVLAATTAIATIISIVVEGRVPLVSVSSSIFVCGAGALSYLFTNPDILIIADSLYYFFTALMVGLGLTRGVFILQWVFGSSLAMTMRGWQVLSWRWVGASALAGGGNEAVRVFATPELWIDYKLVKVVLVLAFVGWWLMLARRYAIAEVHHSESPLPDLVEQKG
jgi:intracellular septation protein